MDHVPAWCLAPDAPQSQFIQLPACKGCNNRYEVPESRFRDFVANVAAGSGNASAQAAYEKFQRWTQQERERLGRPNRDLQRILDNRALALHVTTDGRFLGVTEHVRPAPDFHIQEVFVKIARGIHYYHAGVALPTGHHVYLYTIDQPRFVDAVQAAPHLYYGRHGDFLNTLAVMSMIAAYVESGPSVSTKG